MTRHLVHQGRYKSMIDANGPCGWGIVGNFTQKRVCHERVTGDVSLTCPRFYGPGCGIPVGDPLTVLADVVRMDRRTTSSTVIINCETNKRSAKAVPGSRVERETPAYRLGAADHPLIFVSVRAVLLRHNNRSLPRAFIALAAQLMEFSAWRRSHQLFKFGLWFTDPTTIHSRPSAARVRLSFLSFLLLC